MKQKIVLLNDLFPDLDWDMNGYYYNKETKDTGVIYKIDNIMNGKSYIGRSYSYHGENDNLYRHGAKGRFKTHWYFKSIYNAKHFNDCPFFYEALRESDIHDWFVYVLKVCPKNELQKWETIFIRKYNTSDPNIGYNIFVGNNKPEDIEHLKKYQNNKALSNTNRAENSKMKRTEKNKNLPTYISYYPITKDNVLIREGYMVRIKVNGKNYKKIFTSMDDTMETKLNKAKEYLESVKKNDNNSILNKGAQRKVNKSKDLPTNIRYFVAKRDGKIFGEGYSVEIKINGKRYKKVFTSMDESMESKLSKAKKQIELFKLEASKCNTGSKTNKRNI